MQVGIQREEKILDASLEAIFQRVADFKNSLETFVKKLEFDHEHLNWPSMLDSFALLSSQLNTLNKILRSEKTPALRNQSVIPLLLSPDKDQELLRLTEGRVPVFSHEVVPDHLRTKPEPEVEELERSLAADASRLAPDLAQKQIQVMNKLCSNLLDKLAAVREEREADTAGLRQSNYTYNQADTNVLVSAVTLGKHLCRTASPSAMNMPTPSMVPQQQPAMPTGKLPSSIKTNIKSASSVHPYPR
uniref:mediator of RNA polymerase II transcription subunit 8 isoform X2 n=1 Tax=Myxine glutinosa TaxID=7769 RepID=UPI00358FEC6B